MQTIDVKITGTKPLLQHRFTDAASTDEATRRVTRAEKTPRELATEVANVDPDGRYWMPGSAIARLLRESGGNHKQKGSRRSVKYIVPSAVFVTDDTMTVLNGDGKTPATEFEVDSRPVQIPATKGRIMRHRPRFDHWSLRFRLEVDDNTISPSLVHDLLSEGGSRIGIGDFRPEKGGPFGRFQITEWAVVE